MTIRVVPTGAALGADIDGVDLGEAPDAVTSRAIADAWAAHLVLRFRNQHLTDDAFQRFSRSFGELDLAPITTTGKRHLPDQPYVAVMSNVMVDGTPIGSLGAYESVWHTDMSYNPEPPSASLLYALEIPPAGGDTSFANMYLAAERLPRDLREQIMGRFIKHDATTNSAGELRNGFAAVSDPRTSPGAIHPILRQHPVTKREALFLGRRTNAYIVGLPLDWSEQLLDRLFAHVAQPEFVWTQQWRVGDLVIWDNRCVMHRRDAFDPNSRRLLHRTQVKGDAPVPAIPD